MQACLLQIKQQIHKSLKLLHMVILATAPDLYQTASLTYKTGNFDVVD